jgi:hypothetical protein
MLLRYENIRNSEGSNGLDRIRLRFGNEKLVEYIMNLHESNPKHAELLLNGSRVSFTCIYLLKRNTDSSKILNNSSLRNKKAVQLVDRVAQRSSSDSAHLYQSDFYEENRDNRNLYKWILETGYRDDGLDEIFDEILDIAAIILLGEYKEKRYLKIVADLIFSRHERGAYFYDLVWAYFRCRRLECISLIAQRLRSPVRKDVELARKLLSFVPCVGNRPVENSLFQYYGCMQWLEENGAYLYYTGESYQQKNNPCPFAISHEAKYLNKPLKEFENYYDSDTNRARSSLYSFSNLDEKAKEKLSSYSYRLYRRNKKSWEIWINSPLDEQLKIAGYRPDRDNPEVRK